MRTKRLIAAIWLILVFGISALSHATVSSETTKVSYTCNGVLTTYAYTFKIFEDDDLLAVKALTSTGTETTLVLNTDYTVTGAGNSGGGNVILTTGSKCASGYSLTLLRNMDITQETDYVDGEAFSAESFENALDRLTIVQQQHGEALDRALKNPVKSTATLPGPVKNNYIGWNSTATALENKITALQVGASSSTNQDYYADADAVDQGDGSETGSIASLYAAIGTSKSATIVLAHSGAGNTTTYTLTTALDATAYKNVTLSMQSGAILSYAANVTIPRMDEHGMHQRFNKVSGTLSLGTNAVSRIVPQWWGASSAASAAVNSAAFQAALDSIGTYPSIPLYIPGVTIGSITPYQINTALTKTSADWIRIKGDGPGSWLEWTGADYATMLTLTGTGGGNAEVDSVRFDCNNKATTGLSMNAFGHGISVTGNEFNDGLANVADDQGMLNIPILTGETHNGLIQRNYFGGGTAIGLGLGLTGAASGSAGFDISVNEFQQINNIAIKGKGLKEPKIVTNVVDNVLANTNGAGFWLDIIDNATIEGNHMETLAKHAIKLNTTGRYDFRPTTGRITNNLITGCTAWIDLGYTDAVEVAHNSILNTAGVNWLAVTVNAKGTILGKNQVSSGLAGVMSWHEQYVTGAGFWNNRFGVTNVFSTAALLTLASQSVSADWVTLSPISTLNTPDIPSDARGWIVQASIRSATVGARLYLFSAADLVLWANRAIDIRVQFIEAQAANRYNTATIIIPAVNQSYEDLFSYGISDGGVTDTDVELRLIGYLMPT